MPVPFFPEIPLEVIVHDLEKYTELGAPLSVEWKTIG